MAGNYLNDEPEWKAKVRQSQAQGDEARRRIKDMANPYIEPVRDFAVGAVNKINEIPVSAIADYLRNKFVSNKPHVSNPMIAQEMERQAQSRRAIGEFMQPVSNVVDKAVTMAGKIPFSEMSRYIGNQLDRDSIADREAIARYFGYTPDQGDPNQEKTDKWIRGGWGQK